MRKAPVLIVSALCLLALLPAARAQQQQESPKVDPALARSREQDRQTAIHMLHEYPALPAAPLAKVVQFRIEQNNLAVYTQLEPTVGMSQIPVTDLTGLCAVDIRRFGQPKAPGSQPYTPMAMQFMRHDFSAPGFSESLTTVQITPMNLQVSLDQETPDDEVRSVSLMQSGPSLNNDEPAVRLRVRTVSRNGDAPAVNITRGAADFLSLRRKYPAETAKYLEPIFRSLHADAVVFDADPRVAWQVFSDVARPDPAVTARVKQILADMDADDFHTREAAAQQLKQIGQPAAVALEHLDRSPLSPEQNSRVEAFLSMYHPVTDEQADRLRGDVNFLLDCLLDEDDPFIVNVALDRLRAITHQAVPFDPSLRGAARQTAVYELRQTLTAAPQPAIGAPTTAPAAVQPTDAH